MRKDRTENAAVAAIEDFMRPVNFGVPHPRAGANPLRPTFEQSLDILNGGTRQQPAQPGAAATQEPPRPQRRTRRFKTRRR